MGIRRAKWLIVGFCGTLLIAAALALHYIPRHGIDKRLEAIRAQGLPASPAELDAWYKPVPDAENQALLILDAVKARTGPGAGTNALSDPLGAVAAGQMIPSDMEESVNRYVAANQSALALLDKAVVLPRSRYPMDLGLGAYTLLPHLAQVKGLVQLLRVQAVQQSHLGKPEEAVHSLSMGFIIAASLKNEPVLISDLVRIACIGKTLDGLERVLSEHQLNAEQLSSLSAKLAEAEADGLPALFRALVGERAGSISVFKMSFSEVDRLGTSTAAAAQNFGREALSALGSQAYKVTGLRERDLALYLESMESLINASKQDFPTALRDFERAASEKWERLSHGLGRFAIYCGMLLPALDKAALKEATITARLRCTEAVLAIEHFRFDHSTSLPDSLEQLVPKYLPRVPVDPFDARPLAFERLPGEGYRVTSPGASSEHKSATSPQKDVIVSVLR